MSKLLAETPLLSAPTPPLGQARGDPATCLALPSPGHPEAGPEQEVQVMDGPQWGSCPPGPLCQQPRKPVTGLVTPATTHGARSPRDMSPTSRTSLASLTLQPPFTTLQP